MLVPYLRSSSIGTFKHCELKHHLTYIMGFPDKAGHSACAGTIFHTSAELRGLANLAIQQDKDYVLHDVFGKVSLEWAIDYNQNLPVIFEYYKEKETQIDFDKKMSLKKIIKWCDKTYEKWPHYDPLNMNLIYVEKHFDIMIEEDWAYYDVDIEGQKFKGYMRIVGTIDNIIDLGDNVYQIHDWKGLPIETPIPTPNGWTTMGDLKVGDIVFDQYGKQVKILAKSSQKNKDCYEINFYDNVSVICDDEHKWKLVDGSVVSIKDLKVGDQIRTSSAIKCEEKELPLDPYLLGIWLGNGRNRSFEICGQDQFIFDQFISKGFSLGVNQEKRNETLQTRTVLSATKILKNLNLLNNKHIPTIYLRSSYDQRLELLKGLMDSDGYANISRKQGHFSCSNKKLSEDVYELLLTLGQKPLLHDITRKYKNETRKTYPIDFSPININPFKLPRKKEIVDKWIDSKNLSWRRPIKSITKIDKKITQCIMVDSKDHTFLCSKHMIPTHNSGQKRQDFVTDEEKDHKYLETKDHQMLFYLYAAKKIWPDKEILMTLHFINAGGVFTVAGTDEMLNKAEKMIKKTFKNMINAKKPQIWDIYNNDWRCEYCCWHSKETEKTGKKSLCQFMDKEIKQKGLETVIAENTNWDKFGVYGDGGGKTSETRKKKDDK